MTGGVVASWPPTGYHCKVMATLALGVLLAPLPGGSFIGALIGSYIDNTLLFPALRGSPEDITGPRLDDLRIQTASEGALVTDFYGYKSRSACTVIWLPDMIETEHEEEQEGGGKGGGGGPTVTTFTYAAHACILVGKQGHGGLIYKVKKIWADSKTIYNDDSGPAVDVTSSVLSAIRKTYYTWSPFPMPAGSYAVEKRYLIIRSPSGGPDLTQFTSGVDVTVSGWPTSFSFTLAGGTQFYTLVETVGGTVVQSIYHKNIDIADMMSFQPGINVTTSGYSNAVNNGTFPCHSAAFVLDTSTGILGSVVRLTNAAAVNNNTSTVTMTQTPTNNNNGTFQCEEVEDMGAGVTELRLNNLHALTQPAGSSITLGQAATQDFDPTEVGDIRVRFGEPTQQPDSLMEAIAGSDNVSAYRDRTTIVIESMQLRNYGNRFPQINVLVQARVGTTHVSTLIEDILVYRGGLLTSDFVISPTLASEEAHAYAVSGPQSTVEVLEPVLLAHDVLVQDEGLNLRFFPHGEESIVTVDSDDLAAHQSGSQAPQPLIATDIAGYDLPQEAIIDFIDNNAGFQRGSVRERRIQKVTDRVVRVEVPMVMHGNDARRIAKRMLWSPWANRLKGSIALPPSYINLLEGDIAHVVDDSGESYKIRVTELTRGNNFVIEAKGIVEAAGSLTFGETSTDDPDYTDEIIYTPPAMMMVFADIAPLTVAQALEPGIFFGCSTAQYGDEWKGAVLYYSTDGITYVRMLEVPHQSTVVIAETRLGYANHNFTDRANTVDVKVLHGTLSSRTDLEVLNGANRLYLGGEVLGFQTATLIGSNRYRLSNLLRGLRDTETRGQTYYHQIGELGMMLDTSTFIKFDRPLRESGLFFKLVPAGKAMLNVQRKWKMLASATLQPSTPTQITTSRDGSNNITVRWVRRTRIPVRLFSPASAPLIDDLERYYVEFYIGKALKRSKTVDSASTLTYTAAEQTTDGVTPGTLLDIIIYQANRIGGFGIPVTVSQI